MEEIGWWTHTFDIQNLKWCCHHRKTWKWTTFKLMNNRFKSVLFELMLRFIIESRCYKCLPINFVVWKITLTQKHNSCWCHLALQKFQVINSNLWFMCGNCYCSAMKVNKRKWQIRDGQAGHRTCSGINEKTRWALCGWCDGYCKHRKCQRKIWTELIQSWSHACAPIAHSFVRSLARSSPQSSTWSSPLPV